MAHCRSSEEISSSAVPDDHSGGNGLPGRRGVGLRDTSSDRPTRVLTELLKDVGRKCRAGFLIEPPVVVQDEGTVGAAEHVGILLDPAKVVRSLRRNRGDIHKVGHRRLAGASQADHSAAVGPSDEHDGWRRRVDHLAYLGRVVGQARRREPVGRQVRNTYVYPGAVQELPHQVPVVRVAPQTVNQDRASPEPGLTGPPCLSAYGSVPQLDHPPSVGCAAQARSFSSCSSRGPKCPPGTVIRVRRRHMIGEPLTMRG